jgi:hypothetical protein
MNQPVPFSRRRGDWLIVGFFLVNLLFITYIVDLEQLVISDPTNFSYPTWPPAFMIDLVHNYGHTYDPLVIARPVWWKATILIDALAFGPFYAVAIYAYVKGKDWIRIPSIIYGAMLFTIVFIILSEELFGPYRAPQFGVVLALNAPWLLMPIYIIARMWRNSHPFEEQGGITLTAPGAVTHARDR